ncbi:type IV secretory system conjugative DNA transfer family protein [Actinomyces qiguomingii]|uniref:type IV secretory system conjugative DNA transfer family protein n=1 Tax=Actinomyces qiguomingii TaxID=2057800 RepID=UPI000CA05DF1|nr:type IV secretion system DNA-binding domain-containing protein [Actinomyces qiguomingii]
MSGRHLLLWRRVRFALPLDAATATGLLERIVADPTLGRVVLEARGRDGRARYLLGSAAGGRLDAVVRELIPGTRISAATDTAERGPVDQGLRVVARRASLPLSAERLEAIARAVLAALATTGADEELVLQVMIGPRHRPSLAQDTQPAGWLEVLGLTPPPSASGEVGRRRRAQVASHRAGVIVRLGVKAGSPKRRRLLLQSLLGALRVAESAGVHLHAHTDSPARVDQARRSWRYPLTLSAREIACLSGWPIGQAGLPATGAAHPKHLPLPVRRDTRRAFATGADEQSGQKLGVSIRDALFHTVLLGPTGAGKSTAMANLALADIRAGRGVLLIDPKTDLVNDLLARIPLQRHGDVVVIDPTSPTPVGINPLATTFSKRWEPEVIADTVLATFKTLFADAWGVRTEEILTAGLLTLARTPESTLVDLPLLLTNPEFRRWVVAGAPDPLGTGQFWDKYDRLSEAQRMQWIAPVLNKLQPFLIRPHLRATLGQTAPAFDLADLLTKRRIVLVSLNKGILGAESARLLGSLIIGQIWPLILARAALPAGRRHIVSIFIDEVQDYLTLPGDLADALSQARSLGVAFHLAHQYRAQLPPHLRSAVDTNAGNKIIFGLSAADASEIARQAIGLEPADLQLLPRFGAYVRTIHDGHPNPWCLAHTLPLPPPDGDPVALTAASAARYGQDAHTVESQLLRRLGLTQATAGPPPTQDQPTRSQAAQVAIGRRPRRGGTP